VSPGAYAGPTATITPVVGGLAAPRGIAFDGMGSMYVSESGVAGAGPAGLTHSGKVDKYAWGHTTPSWSTSFTSVYATEQPSAPPDVLGPEGITAVGKGRMRHSAGQRMGCQVLMVTGESTPGILAATDGAVTDAQAGRVFRLDGATGAATVKSDVGSQMYQFTTEHQSLFPSDFPDANPYGIVATNALGDEIRTFVADAAANTVLEIMPGGTARVVAYIPNETAPPFRDATPDVHRGRAGRLPLRRHVALRGEPVRARRRWLLAGVAREPERELPDRADALGQRADHDHVVHLRPAGQLLGHRDVRRRPRRDAAW
jgi:hypothetical protein